MSASERTTKHYQYNPHWNADFYEGNKVTKRMIYRNGLKYYVLDLITVKFQTNDFKYVAYELCTNQLVQLVQLCHPFENINSGDIGVLNKLNKVVIVGVNADNVVTAALFELIMMDDEMLNQNCGMHDVQSYRGKLIEQLFGLRDVGYFI